MEATLSCSVRGVPPTQSDAPTWRPVRLSQVTPTPQLVKEKLFTSEAIRVLYVVSVFPYPGPLTFDWCVIRRQTNEQIELCEDTC